MHKPGEDKQQRPKPWVLVLCVLGAIGFLASTAFHLIGFHGGDFKTYLTAATYLIEDKNPYTLLFIELADGNKQYFADYLYSPLFAFLLIPLASIPWKVSLFIWYVLNTYWLIAFLRLSSKYLRVNQLNKNWHYLFYLLSFVSLLRFIDYNYHLGQMSILLLYGSFYSVHLLLNKKLVTGALLLGLITTIKIIPGLVMVYLLIKGKYKALVYSGLASVLFLLLPSLFVGFQDNLALHLHWWEAINPSDAYFSFESKSGLFNLSAFVPSFFSDMPSDSGLDLKRNILSLSNEGVKLLTHAFRLLFLLLGFYFLRKNRGNKDQRGLYWELSYLLLITPLIFPRQSKYAFVYLLPAMSYLIGYLLIAWSRNRARDVKTVLLGLLVVWLLLTGTSVNIVGRHLYDIFQDFKVITFACFLLIFLLARVNPKGFETFGGESPKEIARV